MPVPIPENMLPLTYKVKLIVKADNLKASDETTLKVVPMTPGFGALAALIAGGMALALRRWGESGEEVEQLLRRTSE